MLDNVNKLPVNKACSAQPSQETLATSSSAEDTVHLSAEMQMAPELTGAVKRSPSVVDSGRLADLKNRISQGSYQVSSADVAEAMLREGVFDDLVDR